MLSREQRKIVLPIIMFPIIILLWKLYIALFNIPPYLLPQPEELMKSMADFLVNGDMISHINTTLKEVFIGVAVGILIGLVLGYIVAKSKFIERFIMPFVLIIQTAPKISLAPLFILWFGLGLQSKIAIVILVVSFPVMINEVVAIRSIDANVFNLMKILDASAWQKFIYIELPYSLQAILSGIKIALTQAMVGAVIGEMIGAKSGLGYLLTLGNETYDINLVLSSIIILSLIGLILYLVAGFVEKKLLIWKEEGV
ncbi:ABC transporter permease [Clostridium malenominatum]|uniref:ABC transporter permease n=1 Tax=Clostridium malenominatum TaxID=1539 RepID=A0ABP3UF67_9CLOT